MSSVRLSGTIGSIDSGDNVEASSFVVRSFALLLLVGNRGWVPWVVGSRGILGFE